MEPAHDRTAPRDHVGAGTRSALWLPLFDELADPLTVARLAAEAEEAGWHGVFVWDQLRWQAPVRQVADPWICLAAIATATEQVRVGPLVTPLPRRRPAKVARETATLDSLSRGRLVLGVGIASDHFAGELSRTGEQLDDRLRGQMLDESLQILEAAWSGEPVHHLGEHYTIDGVQFLPRPVQRPGVPVWVAGFPGNVKPLRRAARYDGFFPANLEHPDQLTEIAATIAELRRDTAARTTSPLASPSAATPCPTPRRAPPGGCRSSRPTRCRSMPCGACSPTAQWRPDHEHGRPRLLRRRGAPAQPALPRRCRRAPPRPGARRRLRHGPVHARGRPGRRQRTRRGSGHLRTHARARPPAQPSGGPGHGRA